MILMKHLFQYRAWNPYCYLLWLVLKIKLLQMNAKTTFLNNFLKEEESMLLNYKALKTQNMLTCFQTQDSSPRVWYKILTKYLTKGYYPGVDKTLFINGMNQRKIQKPTKTTISNRQYKFLLTQDINT